MDINHKNALLIFYLGIIVKILWHVLFLLVAGQIIFDLFGYYETRPLTKAAQY